MKEVNTVLLKQKANQSWLNYSKWRGYSALQLPLLNTLKLQI